MNKEKVRALIHSYIRAYNAFDIDGMMELLHPGIEFKNYSVGKVNAEAYGLAEFRALAEQAKQLFSSRTQTLTDLRFEKDKAIAEIDYHGVLAVDLPNGLKAGEEIQLTGRSEFQFKEGKISMITDYS
ncbi:MAG: nuclear transport factor 2 family protein [Balneolaceae bacterium]